MGFEGLLGQEFIIKVLQDSIKNDSLPHAILFTGPKGCGKGTISMILARALNCDNENAPCENCLSCRNIFKGEHPDVTTIETEGRWIKIDQLREARQNFFYFTHGQGRRVCIIKNAHNLTAEAAASLLKILEDPPPGLVFLMTTPYPAMLPATILSRCQQFKMQRLNNDTMKELLLNTNPDYSPEEINPAVNLGEGIPGRALNILNDPMWEERRDRVIKLGKKIIEGTITEKDSLDEAKEWSGRDDVAFLLELFAYFIKDGLFWKLCQDKEMLSISFLHSFWENSFVDISFLKESLEMLNNLRKNLRTNVNLNLAIETFFLQITGRLQRDV